MKVGRGLLVLKDGTQYEGNFVNGIREGLGKLISDWDYTYEGMWKGGLKEGRGVLTN